MRTFTLVIMLVLGACVTAPRNSAAQSVPTTPRAAPPADASPAAVYRLYDARRAALGAELQKAHDALAPIRSAGREDEYQLAWAAIVNRVDAKALDAFLSDAQVSELAGMSEEDQRMVFVVNLDPGLRPSRVEVASETVNGDHATLEVRVHFTNPSQGRPGWRSGTVKLVREASGWKVDEETWDAPASGEQTVHPPTQRSAA